MLITNIKKNEDDEFKSGGMPYNDSLGIPTIGYGTKLPLSQEECSLLLEYRLNFLKNELIQSKPIVETLSEIRQEVLFEMAYQLGVGGLLKFKKMWKAIESNDFNTASLEMLDSKWYIQTPNRARKLSNTMAYNLQE